MTLPREWAAIHSHTTITHPSVDTVGTDGFSQSYWAFIDNSGKEEYSSQNMQVKYVRTACQISLSILIL